MKSHSGSEPATALTLSAQHSLVDTIVRRLPEGSQLLVPDDSFYIHSSPRKQARHITQRLCRWLGIKPGYIQLHFGQGVISSPRSSATYTIWLDTHILRDEFLLAAHIAFELTRYLVEVKHQEKLSNHQLHHVLLEDTSIACGLGIIILNGYTSHLRPWPFAVQARPVHFESKLYATKLRHYFTELGIEPISYQASLTPWLRRLLGVRRSQRLTAFAREAYHRENIQRLKAMGIAWCVFIFVGISCFTLLQRVKPLLPAIHAARQDAQKKLDNWNTCKQNLAYQEHYLDRNDIQAMRHLDAQRLECQSLENEYQAAERHANELES